MFLSKPIRKQYFLPLAITIVLTAYQLVRIIAFINVYGGIEHDGGWMLSISRSLAETGTYTTMVSTIADPNVLGDINVDQKFDIQAPDGRIWFFTGNGIGPASIIPDALIIKLFGTDFWVLRAGPLIFYTLFLFLTAYILYQEAGLGAVVLFHAFLFFYPHISIFLSYEAMGEVPSMFYVVWAYLAFVAATRKKRRRWLHFLIAGLIAGLAINAKLITLWSLSGIFVWAGILWLADLVKCKNQGQLTSENQRPARLRFSELLWLSSGIPFTIALWELVHLVILTRLAGFEMYVRQAQQRIRFVLDEGSGVGLRIHSGPEFFWDKFFLLEEVTHPQRWVTAIIFLAIFLGGIFLIWQWRSQPARQNLLAPIWLGWFANTAWFVSLAKTGWARHFWFGLVLAMMLLCVITVQFLKTAGESVEESRIHFGLQRYLPRVVGSLLLILVGWGFVSQPHVWGFFLPDEIVLYWQAKQISNKYDASLPWIIIPRAAQAEVIDYINHMPPEAKIYYPGQHKSAEIPPQTGRLHYPLTRRNYVEPHPADIVLLGPSITSPWKDPVQRRDLLDLVAQQCPHPALKNDYYIICPIETNLSP